MSLPDKKPRLDVTKSWAKDRSYELPGSCSNCHAEYTLVISHGYARPLPGLVGGAAECPRCGCEAVTA